MERWATRSREVTLMAFNSMVDLDLRGGINIGINYIKICFEQQTICFFVMTTDRKLLLAHNERFV